MSPNGTTRFATRESTVEMSRSRGSTSFSHSPSSSLISSQNVHSPSTITTSPAVGTSRASFCSFSYSPSSRPDWATVSHLFADGLYELEVLKLDHSSEPTATDRTIQDAVRVGLPTTAVPTVLTETAAGSLFASRASNNLAYRNSVASTVSRMKSTSRRNSVPHPGRESLHVSTSFGSSALSVTPSPATGSGTPSSDYMRSDTITTPSGVNRPSWKLGKPTTPLYDLKVADSACLDDSGLGLYAGFENIGTSNSRPTSRSRSASQRSERPRSRSRSQSQSGLRSCASSILRRSAEIVRTNSTRSLKDSTDSDSIRRSSDSDPSPLYPSLPPLSIPYSTLQASTSPCSNPSSVDSPLNRLRRPRFVPTARAAIPEEGEDESTYSPDLSSTTSILEKETIPICEHVASPSHTPVSAQSDRLSRSASFRQLFRLRSSFPNSKDSSPSSSTPVSRHQAFVFPPDLCSQPQSPDSRRAPLHGRSQSQATAISFTPSLTSTDLIDLHSVTPESSRPHRGLRRRNRLSQLFSAPFRASSTPPPQLSDIDHGSRAEVPTPAVEPEKVERRLSRFRSSILVRLPDNQEVRGKTQIKSHAGGTLLKRTLSPVNPSSPTLKSPLKTNSLSAGTAELPPKAPPIPPPPPISLSAPPIFPLAQNKPTILTIEPSALDPLSLLHVKHRAITDRFDKFVAQQRLNLLEYKSRAMKRVVHAHILARVPLAEELRQYEKAERGYAEFCRKMRQNGLIAAEGSEVVVGPGADASVPETALMSVNKFARNSLQEKRSGGRTRGLDVSFDSGVSFLTVEGDANDSSGPKKQDLKTLPCSSSESVHLSVNVPPSPVPSSTSSVFSCSPSASDATTSQTTPFPSPHTSNLPPAKPHNSGTASIAGTTNMVASNTLLVQPISIPQPPSSPAHSAALLRMSKLDSSMSVQLSRLTEAFEGYSSRLEDLFTYRAGRIIGRWILESRVVLWQWLVSEKQKGKIKDEKTATGVVTDQGNDSLKETDSGSKKMGKVYKEDVIARGILTDPDILDKLDISTVIVPLGWEWHGF